MAQTVPVEISGQLQKSGSVILDANGNGVLTFDPDNMRQRWEVSSVFVKTDQLATATVVPVATLAINSTDATTASPANLRGASWSGNQDTFIGKTDIGPCDFLSVIFSCAPGQNASVLAGVKATAVVAGTKYTRRA